MNIEIKSTETTEEARNRAAAIDQRLYDARMAWDARKKAEEATRKSRHVMQPEEFADICVEALEDYDVSNRIDYRAVKEGCRLLKMVLRSKMECQF